MCLHGCEGVFEHCQNDLANLVTAVRENQEVIARSPWRRIASEIIACTKKPVGNLNASKVDLDGLSHRERRQNVNDRAIAGVRIYSASSVPGDGSTRTWITKNLTRRST